jgi:hypothetical protein
MGGSFTVSNLGMFGLSSFVAIINPPQVDSQEGRGREGGQRGGHKGPGREREARCEAPRAPPLKARARGRAPRSCPSRPAARRSLPARPPAQAAHPNAQAGILAVGGAREVARLGRDGQPEARQVMSVTLSADARVYGGEMAAELLAAFGRHVESPFELLG